MVQPSKHGAAPAVGRYGLPWLAQNVEEHPAYIVPRTVRKEEAAEEVPQPHFCVALDHLIIGIRWQHTEVFSDPARMHTGSLPANL